MEVKEGKAQETGKKSASAIEREGKTEAGSVNATIS